MTSLIIKPVMPALRSELIKSDITVIEVISRFILVGIGNVLHVFSLSIEKCSQFKILNRCTIHGISVNHETERIVIFGSREFVLCSINILKNDISITIISRWNAGDWIWNARLLNDSQHVLLLTANNILSLQNLETGNVNRMVCPDKCLLFCGIILGIEWHDTVVICGSMFKKILVWTPSSAYDNNGAVLHSLQGHKGAIFSVFYHDKLHQICSTSDDRSVRIWTVNFPSSCHTKVESWTKANIHPLIFVYGHMSRVWKSIILDDGRFISVGEDSQLRIWKQDGTPVCCWETHQGASIRSLAVSEQNKVIVTGGKDGGLSVWPLLTNSTQYKHELREITFKNVLGIENIRDIPRRIRLTKLGSLLTVTNSGMVLAYIGGTWNLVIGDSRFASYCLFEISPCRQLIALASIKGDIKIIREFANPIQLKVVFDGAVCEGKIFSFQWLDESRFIICSAEGSLKIWSFELNDGIYSTNEVKRFVLPPCKERWLTAAVEVDCFVIVGDRDGSVHVFEHDIKPLQTFRRVHGRLGVSCISFNGETELRSIGRDGFIRYWNITDAVIEHVAADKLPVKWPVKIIDSRSHGLLVLGFNEVNFEIWNLKERKQLFTHNCGGGHRPWDFIIDQFGLFVYIKEKLVFNIRVPLDQIVKPSFLEGFHIRDVDCLRYLENNIIISGGEDTTLRISIIDEETISFTSVAIIRSHISSIRAITLVRINDFFLVVSAGGRAQLKIWKIIIQTNKVKYFELASHMLMPTSHCKKSWKSITRTSELEPRHMDVDIRKMVESNFLIYAAGSDAFWRIYSFNLNTKLLQLVKEIAYGQYCVLHIIFVNWFHQAFIITMATDGKCSFWDANSHHLTKQYSLHQSGINSYDHTIRDDKLILFTGGDDAVFSCAVFENRNHQTGICSQWKNTDTHEAQISGIRIIKNLVISVAADQKVVLWKWKMCAEEVNVQLLTFCHSHVADIHGCDVIFDQSRICVYGVGFEVISWEIKQSDLEEAVEK